MQNMDFEFIDYNQLREHILTELATRRISLRKLAAETGTPAGLCFALLSTTMQRFSAPTMVKYFNHLHPDRVATCVDGAGKTAIFRISRSIAA